MSFFAELRQLEEKGIDLIEILGQDRHLDSPADLQEIIALLSRDTESLHAELLYYLTYRRFEGAEAEDLWKKIMAHKLAMQDALSRSVSFRVAALDYLSDGKGILQGVHLVARPEFEGVLSYVNIDEVSGVFSRRYFNAQLSHELTRAKRYGKSLALLLVDLDSFKAVNDSLGHVQGDAILRKVGRVLRDSTRQADSVCRFGGDEFAVILPETNVREALATAERMRRAVTKILVPASSGIVLEDGVDAAATEEWAITISVGGGTYPHHAEDAGSLMSVADQMCLAAKRGGKNCCRIKAPPKRDA